MLDDIEEVELQGDAVKHKLHQTEDKLAKMTLKLNEAEQQLRENEQRLRLAEWHSGIMKRQLDMSKEDYHNLEDTVKRESEEYKLELARIEETHESEVARLRQDMRKMKCEQTLAVKDIEQKLLQGEKEIEMLQRRLEQLEKASAEESILPHIIVKKHIAPAPLEISPHSPPWALPPRQPFQMFSGELDLFRTDSSRRQSVIAALAPAATGMSRHGSVVQAGNDELGVD